MPKLISHKEAKRRGLTRYFTGKPCKRGHISERRINNHTCIKCVRETSKGYQARYCAKNYLLLREKAKQRRLLHLEKARARTLARHRKIADLLVTLKAEMPELLKEFGL